MENSKFKSSIPNKWRTIVVLPEPEGAENTMSFPCFLFSFSITNQILTLLITVTATVNLFTVHSIIVP
ncbi:hypothetical protein MHTCC0001_31740 [Flavobacteriaceae bacterium MHTCC 0001]